MAPPAGKKDDAPKTLFGSTRHILYIVTYCLLFALACAELGLVSQQLQKYGNDVANYPTPEYKYLIGLGLFNVIFTLILSMGFFKLNMFMGVFFTFAGAVLWGACAGGLFQVSPFTGYNCGEDAASYGSKWAPFVSQCSRVVAIEAIAWTEWALMTILLFGSLADMCSFSVRRHVYFDLPEKGEQV